jgi:hypothetical protein
MNVSGLVFAAWCPHAGLRRLTKDGTSVLVLIYSSTLLLELMEAGGCETMLSHPAGGETMATDETVEPTTYLDLIGKLALLEKVPAVVVEQLLPELARQWCDALVIPESRPTMALLRQELRQGLQAKVDCEGLTTAEAALNLGVTDPSFDELKERKLPNLVVRFNSGGQERFLREDLDAFVSSYLPDFKTWSTRDGLLSEFFENLERATGFQPDPQYCEIDAKNLAALQCSNPACRKNAPPRKICVRHRERLRNPSDKSLCSECVHRTLYGDLKGQFQIGGTEDRLRRDYPE